MSRIKTEIDRALEYYGDQATVFRVVRRATNKTDSSLYRLRRARLAAQRKHMDGIITRKRRIRRYISHFRGLLPFPKYEPIWGDMSNQGYNGFIDWSSKPYRVTTERLREYWKTMLIVRVSNGALHLPKLTSMIKAKKAMEGR